MFPQIFILTVMFSCVSLAPNCFDRDLRHCMSELKVLTSNQDLAFAMTEEELNMTCGHLKEAMECVNNFTTRCFDPTQRDVYRTLTSGAQELILDLCTHGSTFRKQYLVHASCYKGLKPEYKKCTEDYSMKQEALKKEDFNSEEKLRRSCCYFDYYQQCTRSAVLSKCSIEAADIGEQIVTKAGGPLVQAYCSSYKHDSPDCSTGSSLAHVPQHVVVLLLLIAIVVNFGHQSTFEDWKPTRHNDTERVDDTDLRPPYKGKVCAIDDSHRVEVCHHASTRTGSR